MLQIPTSPANVVMYAPVKVTAGSLTLVLVTGADLNGAGGTFAAGSGVAAQIAGTTVTYEVTAASDTALESVAIPLAFFTTGPLSSTGAAAIIANLGPISGNFTSVAGASVPRFVAVNTSQNSTILNVGTCNPVTVTINQAFGQPDPTNAPSVHFTPIFSEAVSGFSASGVTITGTAPGTKTVRISGGNTTYDVQVTGMTDAGTVIATIGAGVANAVASGIPNSASTSTDNTISFVPGGTIAVGATAGLPGSTVAVPISLTFTPGTTINLLDLVVQIVAVGSAPSLSGVLTFEPSSGVPVPTTVSADGSNGIEIYWGSSFSLNGTSIGNVKVTIPQAATSGEVYLVHILQAVANGTGTVVYLLVAPDVTLTVGQTPSSSPVIGAISPTNTAAGGPGFTLTATGANFISSSTIQWNGLALPTTFVNSSQLTAAVSAGTIAKAGLALITVSNPASLGSNSFAFPIYLPLQTNDLVYDKVGRKIFASIPTSAGLAANGIASIDPVSGLVSQPVSLGTDPGILAISDNGQYVYAAIDGGATVRRFDIGSQAAGLQFSLGSDAQFPQFGPYYVEDMRVLPGIPGSVAVSRTSQNVSGVLGLAIYDDGILRPNTVPDNGGASSIEFSSSPSVLYGFNGWDTGYDFRTMALDSSGVKVTNSARGLLFGYFDNYLQIRFDNGLIYSTSGAVVDPVALTLNGTYNAKGLVVPSSPVNRTFFVTASQSSGYTLQIFDQQNFNSLGSLNISGVAGTPESLIQLGSFGLAFRTTSSQVFIIPTELTAISLSPADMPAGGAAFTVAVNGIGFVSGSTVRWNGSNRPTTFVSNTQLWVVIDSIDISSQGTAQISVLNPGSSGETSNTIVFTIDSVAPKYMVGDAYPAGSDSVGGFGDNVLNNLDLIYALRAVTNVPGFLPAVCSDRFDAMDSYPPDTDTARGGDGVLNNLDLISTLRRVTNVDTSRPLRASRGLACPASSPQFAPQGQREERTSTQPPVGALELGKAESVDGGVRVPIYLRAKDDLYLSGLSLSLGTERSAEALGFAPADAAAPTLLDNALPGILALSWISEIRVASGKTALLGYVKLSGGSTEANSLRIFGLEANAGEDNHTVHLSSTALHEIKPRRGTQ